MLKRLRIKFICINMAIVTIMLAIIFGTVLNFTRTNLEQNSLQMMREALVDEGRINRPGAPGQPVPMPHFVLHLDRSGALLSSTSSYYDLSDEAFLEELISITANSEQPDGVLRQYDLRFLRLSTPRGQVLVFADMSTENSILSGLMRNCSIIALGSFLLFLIISILLAHWAIRPVEQAWKQQRQFVADASHELKTPLTVISTNAELLQNSLGDPEVLSRSAANILTVSGQMRSLVENLLELARVDNGASKTDTAELDLSQLVSDATLPFEPLFFEKALLLEEEIDPGIRLKGSLSHLRQLPDILLDNAMKYADPDSTVRLRLKKQGTHALLSVSNAGSPIPHEELKNIFKRFYRTDKVRTHSGSYGLGLSIAQSIVHAHRGKIWAESTDGINTFFIQLPL